MVVNELQLRFQRVTPAGGEGPADVVVANANGSDTYLGGFVYVVPGGCLFDLDFDGDVDGFDLAIYLNGNSFYDFYNFAIEFGSINCQ